ncbi:Cyclin, C-terminal domain [Dillenia turbinata]|uniref:Cyclin, C-terminal domain n=1 Tax=Dillenia turbinata TaxID=194707 RepID=A0AAN8W5T0_9MAGN
MASTMIPDQNRVDREGKNQKNVAGEGRNRRALGDIGNLVPVRGVERKSQNQISRPITRGFCAQLLANAQAAAAENNNKKKIEGNVDGVIVIDGSEAAAAVPKNVQRRVPVKPKPNPENVIEISSDIEKKDVKKETNKPSRSSSSKKNVHSLTSVLTARSKAACGLTNRPKEQIIDIDAADADNELAVVEYVEDMYIFYKLAESESRVHDYIDSQPEINDKMRAILVDWLIEVHNRFELLQETLYLTINIVDRYLSMKMVPRRELQLVGLGAMLIACKYEEIWAPEVNDFVCISDKAYTHQQILVMEKSILGRLEWYLTVPTPYVFLARFMKASIPDNQMENLVYFFGELGTMNYATSIIYCPSMLAAAAVYAARCTLGKSPVWNETLKKHSGYSEPQLMDCAKLLVSFHHGAPEGKLKVIYRKYSNSERGCVALLPPAKSLL